MPQNPHHADRTFPSLLTLCASISLLMLSASCSSDPAAKGPTTRTSDAALTDPYGKWSNVDTNISGGDTPKPEKGGWKDDLDRLFLK